MLRRHTRRIAGMMLLLLGCAGLAGAQDDGVLRKVVATYGGACQELAVFDDYIYAGNGSTLCVYDARPGQSPPYKKTFEHHYRSAITALEVHDGFLYVAANHDGIAKWDLFNPRKPIPAGVYTPTATDQAAHDFTFLGDSIFVALGTRIGIFRERGGIGGPKFELLRSFAELEGNGRITGGDATAGIYACTVGWKVRGVGEGVHIYERKGFSRINFHQEDFSDAEDLVFVDGGHRLLVAGGSGTTSERPGAGLLYALDVTDPGHPTLSYTDTLRAVDPLDEVRIRRIRPVGEHLFLCGGAPREGRLCEDGTRSDAMIAYSAAPENMRPVSTFTAGPENHDIVFLHDKAHVATGPGGIYTFERHDVPPADCARPTDFGRTPTGGGNMGSDVFENLLLTAQGAAGMTVSDISNRKAYPVRSYNRPGICTNARFTSDGSHIVGFFRYAEGDSIRLLDARNMREVASVPGPFWHDRVVMWQDRIFAARKGDSGYDIIDVRKPRTPKKERTVLVNLHDLSIDNQGHLIVTTNHRVRILDVNDGKFSEMLSMSKWGEGFAAAAGWNGEIFVYARKRGLIRYKLHKSGDHWLLKEKHVLKPPHREPDHLAVDAHGVYAAYNDHGLYVLDRANLTTAGYYRTGMEYLGRPEWGIRDLFCRQDRLFLVEFHGQTTVLVHRDAEK